VVAKEILKDLWREAQRIHLETAAAGQPRVDTQTRVAAGGD
jgi:hypothetical protein